jgi:putative endonuclease
MNQKTSFVYILASERNGTLYVGVTSDLAARGWQHKQKAVAGFTKKYAVDRLVYYEVYDDIAEAIKREKIIKEWKRLWKLRLIEENNPEWNDFYETLNA